MVKSIVYFLLGYIESKHTIDLKAISFCGFSLVTKTS